MIKNKVKSFNSLYNLLKGLGKMSSAMITPTYKTVNFYIKGIWYTFEYVPDKLTLTIETVHLKNTIEVNSIWAFYNLDDKMGRLYINGKDVIIKLNKKSKKELMKLQRANRLYITNKNIIIKTE